ncbi:Holliday junction resolvase RuvX [Alteromonas sp. ASW11-36]|uniref:Putative pre-16S rRNA nuclease n=1 Tax=Alteromonas arenosi TaxID=3055817 RepID=A0ABT7STI8_9ALTE|nr:Holliday junction resolvase RuvX [Alteromonas sp. ASW11-36]MDM7859503.1 Holliday junction resolvase RuvX [Alteromonas sp. ASW11-36]
MSDTLLCFDFGEKSIGVAVGQSITRTASPLAALKANDGIPDWQLIANLYAEWLPTKIIVGMPLNMDGTEQPISARAKKFGDRLHGRFRKPVELWDERLSTVDAKAELFELGGYKKLEKGKIDSVSACLILQSWFDNQY